MAGAGRIIARVLALLLILYGAIVVVRAPGQYRIDRQLLDAVYQGRKERVEQLLAAGASVNAREGFEGLLRPWGATALMAALRLNHSEIATLLLSRGADIHARDSSGKSALSLALLENNLPLVRQLLAKGADTNGRINRVESEMLMARSLEALQLLLNAGADSNTPLGEGVTPLMRLAAHEPALIEVLLRRGARVEARDSAGRTALIYALGLEENVGAVNPTAVRILLDHGADPTPRKGSNPLAHAEISYRWARQFGDAEHVTRARTALHQIRHALARRRRPGVGRAVATPSR